MRCRSWSLRTKRGCPNPIYTDWPAIIFYRSKLHSQPNQLHCSLSSWWRCVYGNSSANELDTVLMKRCIVCACLNVWHKWRRILHSKSLLTRKLVLNLVPSVTLLGDGLPNEECHFNDIIMFSLMHVNPSPAAPSCMNKITGGNIYHVPL